MALVQPAGGGWTARLGNNYFTEMCSGSEEGSYSRLIDFVYHLTLSLRVVKKKRNGRGVVREDSRCPLLDHE